MEARFESNKSRGPVGDLTAIYLYGLCGPIGHGYFTLPILPKIKCQHAHITQHKIPRESVENSHFLHDTSITMQSLSDDPTNSTADIVRFALNPPRCPTDPLCPWWRRFPDADVNRFSVPSLCQESSAIGEEEAWLPESMENHSGEPGFRNRRCDARYRFVSSC